MTLPAPATQHHTAEDLRHYQQLLERIDGARVDGVFCGNLEASTDPRECVDGDWAQK